MGGIASLARDKLCPCPDPRQFLSWKLFLGKLLPKPKLYTKFEVP